MTEMETEIERVSNLWTDWIAQNGFERLKDRHENVQREIDEVVVQLENSDLSSNLKILYHAKLLTGM